MSVREGPPQPAPVPPPASEIERGPAIEPGRVDPVAPEPMAPDPLVPSAHYYPAEKVRGGEIILRTPGRRAIFIGGLVGLFLLALLLGALA